MRAGGISPEIGAAVAQDIEDEFREHRSWHQQVRCSFSDGILTLVATNDFDPKGLALSDEFSDCIAAYVPIEKISGEGPFEVIRVEVV